MFVQVSLPEEFRWKNLHEVLNQRINISDEEVRGLIQESIDNEHTLTYDVIQRQQSGILSVE